MRDDLLPDRHRELLTMPLVAHLATVRPDGSPQSNPVWFRWTGTSIELSQVASNVKVRNMRLNPAVSLSILDPANAFRFVEIRGKVVEISPDTAGAFVSALAEHYTGRPPHASMLEQDRVRVVVEPVHFARELGYRP